MKSPHPNRDHVAIVLATGLSVAVVVLALAVVWVSIQNNRGLSENSTQVLTAALTGMVGLLGGYIGGQRRPTDPSGEVGEVPPAVDDAKVAPTLKSLE